jgi:hypothetical protein
MIEIVQFLKPPGSVVRFRSIKTEVHMTIRFPRILLSLFLCGAFIKPVSAQVMANIVDAPFTATLTYNHAGQAPLIMPIARASDGSTYRGAPINDGNSGPFIIEDVPNHRRIQFSAYPPITYTHTYRLTTQSFVTESIEQHRERLRRCKGSEQDWDTELGIRVSNASAGAGQQDWVVSDVRREEPDPRLFQIPEEYLSDPLLDARTVFVENQTGISEVDKVSAQFSRDLPRVKPLAVVEEKSAADLTAVFTKVSVDELKASPQAVRMTPSPVWASGIKMRIYLRGSSEPAFETAAGSPGTVKGDWFGAVECVTALWNRVANTHVGEWPPPEATKPKELAADH